MSIVYVLQLKDEKYYVGRTNDLKRRFQEHLEGTGTAWTRKFPPISIVTSQTVITGSEEDAITKEYMIKYGIENVRGGTYSNVILQNEQIHVLMNEFCTARNTCFRCGKTGHYAQKCYLNKHNVCYRCGRSNHLATGCYATKHINGNPLNYSIYVRPNMINAHYDSENSN